MKNREAVSSRIRLARNIAGLPFSFRMKREYLDSLIDAVDDAINKNGDFMRMNMQNTSALERQMLVERHLISPDLAMGAGATFIDRTERLSIMVGEEDHIRIQCLTKGVSLEEADDLAAAVDRAIGKTLPYAYDEKYGYLTACPTNLGTGMRASVMMHLPSLTGKMEQLSTLLAKIGYTVRGLYGEGSGALGHLYQVSNQITLQTEEAIISGLNETVNAMLAREREAREAIMKANPIAMEDVVMRSFGILSHARSISEKESFEHISNCKVGAATGILPKTQRVDDLLTSLFTDVQSASLQKLNGRTMERNERDAVRANMLRGAMKKIEEGDK